MDNKTDVILVAVFAALALCIALTWIWWPRIRMSKLWQMATMPRFDINEYAVTRPATPTWQTWAPDWFAFPPLWRDPLDDKLEQQAIDRTWADYEGWPHRRG